MKSTNLVMRNESMIFRFDHNAWVTKTKTGSPSVNQLFVGEQ